MFLYVVVAGGACVDTILCVRVRASCSVGLHHVFAVLLLLFSPPPIGVTSMNNSLIIS
jgi:hypothetical protein